jgi:methionyl-tRNA formyltransferase
MSKFRILFLGTPDFAVTSLSRLISDAHFEIAAVVTQPDRPAGRKMQLKTSPVKDLALKHGLKVFSPETVNSDEFRDAIAQLGAESAVVVAFGQILDLFPRGSVNVHGSLLPRWRGAAPIQRALMAGDSESGVALQIVVRKLDAGPLLGVRRVEITDETDALKLHDQLKICGADLLHVEYMDYLRGNLSPSVQDEALVTIAPKIDKIESKINWSRSAREVFNQVRGLVMGPVATVVSPTGQVVKLYQTRVAVEQGKSSPPGEIIAVSPSSFTVACAQGALEILQVQPESRSRQSVADYLRGYPVKVSDRFT